MRALIKIFLNLFQQANAGDATVEQRGALLNFVQKFLNLLSTVDLEKLGPIIGAIFDAIQKQSVEGTLPAALPQDDGAACAYVTSLVPEADAQVIVNALPGGTILSLITLIIELLNKFSKK